MSRFEWRERVSEKFKLWRGTQQTFSTAPLAFYGSKAVDVNGSAAEAFLGSQTRSVFRSDGERICRDCSAARARPSS